MTFPISADPFRPPQVCAAENVARHREADHRIANSLQLLSALLSSQGREVHDPVARAALDISVLRIGAIAGVHRQLYASADGCDVDLGAYLADLVSRLQSSFSCGGGHRRIRLNADAVTTSSDFAGGIGIIVTELVINACKHAYPCDQEGDVEVSWKLDAIGRYFLEVRDSGRGRGDIGEPGGGLGTRVVDLMSRKLGAEGGYARSGAGTRFRLTGSLPLL